MRNTLTLAVAGLACSGVAFAQTQVTPTPVSNPLRAVKTGGLNNPAASGSLLYDNGPPDGVNGYSNATVGAFGARRTLLDDFNVPAGGWDLGCIEWNHLWNTFPAGSGTGAEFEFFNDNAGSPDTTSSVGVANVTSYTEIATGAVFFSRPEAIGTATFDTISLGTGTYWFEGTVIGGENNFWLTATQQGNECWVNYDDLGGLQPGTTIFGGPSDLAWRLFEGGPNDRITIYCDDAQNPNNAADIDVSGNVLSQGPIIVGLTNAPPNQFGYLLIGNVNGIVSQPPGAKGDLCVVGGFIGRYDGDVVIIDGAGTGSTDIENSNTAGPGYAIPNGGGNIQPGDTWYFQYWHRQPQGQPATFSSAACVTFKQ